MIGKHDYHCDFGCPRVKNGNPFDYNNGLRCYPITGGQQEKFGYCCKEGRTTAFPACPADLPNAGPPREGDVEK